MIIFYGERFYGKVDVVPGLFHVVTVFFHLEFFPLVPLRSCIVLAGSGGQTGMVTSMSLKSVLIGWLRAALVVSMLVSGIMAVVGYLSLRPGEPLSDLSTRLAWFGGSFFLYWITLRLGRASHTRALELGAQLGLPPEAVEERLGANPQWVAGMPEPFQPHESQPPEGYPAEEPPGPQAQRPLFEAGGEAGHQRGSQGVWQGPENGSPGG